MHKHISAYAAAGAPRPRRTPYPDVIRQAAETSAVLPIRSNLSSVKQAAELSQLKELETLLRELLDREILPQVWDNRLSKQLRNVDKSRART